MPPASKAVLCSTLDPNKEQQGWASSLALTLFIRSHGVLLDPSELVDDCALLIASVATVIEPDII